MRAQALMLDALLALSLALLVGEVDGLQQGLLRSSHLEAVGHVLTCLSHHKERRGVG